MHTLEDTFGRESDVPPVSAVAIKNGINLALVVDFILQKDILILHIVIVPNAHPGYTNSVHLTN